MKVYRYGMRLRWFFPGCQPMEGLILRCLDRNDGYHDCLLYDRKLTEKELREYKMDYIGEIDIK